MQQNNYKRFVIKVVSQANPLQLRVPVTPGMTGSGIKRGVTIDACTFTTDQTAPFNKWTINPQGDVVKLLFNNGFGVYNEQGKMTRILQVLDCTLQHRDITSQRKQWHLVGSPDQFVWSEGHDLQIGFTDINDGPVNFVNLNTQYVLTLQIQLS